MLIASFGGHLPLCKWLLEVGAVGDIARANNDGITPLYGAYHNGYLPICQWLILNGALNDSNTKHIS